MTEKDEPFSEVIFQTCETIQLFTSKRRKKHDGDLILCYHIVDDGAESVVVLVVVVDVVVVAARQIGVGKDLESVVGQDLQITISITSIFTFLQKKAGHFYK